MGDWILGENYQGNHNEHVEVNRLLKKYYEKDIPYFRTTTRLSDTPSRFSHLQALQKNAANLLILW